MRNHIKSHALVCLWLLCANFLFTGCETALQNEETPDVITGAVPEAFELTPNAQKIDVETSRFLKENEQTGKLLTQSDMDNLLNMSEQLNNDDAKDVLTPDTLRNLEKIGVYLKEHENFTNYSDSLSLLFRQAKRTRDSYETSMSDWKKRVDILQKIVADQKKQLTEAQYNLDVLNKEQKSIVQQISSMRKDFAALNVILNESEARNEKENFLEIGFPALKREKELAKVTDKNWIFLLDTKPVREWINMNYGEEYTKNRIQLKYLDVLACDKFFGLFVICQYSPAGRIVITEVFNNVLSAPGKGESINLLHIPLPMNIPVDSFVGLIVNRASKITCDCNGSGSVTELLIKNECADDLDSLFQQMQHNDTNDIDKKAKISEALNSLILKLKNSSKNEWSINNRVKENDRAYSFQLTTGKDF